MRIEQDIKGLGDDIVNCKKSCDGVRNDHSNGYYPRPFFIEAAGASRIHVAVIGENPGQSSALEREFYKVCAEHQEGGVATYDDCVRAWRSISSEVDYYLRTKHLLDEWGVPCEGLLWAEVVFCEKSEKRSRIPKGTFETCSQEYLKNILKIVPKEAYILCLGRTSLKYTRKLLKGQNRKIIGIYHPTGSRLFHEYFKDEKGKSVLQGRIREDFSLDKIKGYPSFLTGNGWKIEKPQVAR